MLLIDPVRAGAAHSSWRAGEGETNAIACLACGRPNPAESRFCNGCGARLAPGCPACGHENEADSAFCGGCGARLSGSGTRPAAPPVVEPPASFCGNRYVVESFLGEGARKRVYLAHDRKLERKVAFALFKTDGLDAEGLVRIRREAQAMARLGDHPHIVTVYDAGDEDGTPFMVGQHMPGGSVEALLRAAPGRRLALDQAMRLAQQVADALAHAHARGVIHRDVKPGNVWLDESGDAAIGDFGLAVSLDRSRMTLPGMIVGTVAYMAPEQALGRTPDARADLYALGAMLYEMVCGRAPFLGEDAVGIISQHINTAPVAPSWHEASVSRALESLILRLLAKSPEDRPRDAREVAVALRSLRGAATRTDEHAAPLVPDVRGMDWGRFVGRRGEMDQLKESVEAALGGRSAFAFIAGEPGIGKTRMADEFAVYAELRGFRIVRGNCYEGEQTVPYRPFIDGLRQYVRAADDGELRAQMGAGAPEIAQVLSEIRQRFPDVAPAPALDAEAERLRLFDSVTAFLRGATLARPLMIVIDDLHWADRPSLQLLQHIARHAGDARLLLVATYRDVELDRTHPLGDALTALRRLPGFTRIGLRGLSRETVEEFLATIDASTDGVARHALAAALFEETEGNPFFIREVLSHLVEEGKLVRREGRWVGNVTRISDLGIPEGVRDVIGRRLSRLSEACNRMLSRASAMMRGFTWDALRAINAEVNDGELLDLLDEAARAQIIAERRGETPAVYDFTHALIRHTLYDELSGPRRVILHREIATALEELYAGAIDAHVGELAYHYYQAAPGGDVERAISYARRAGDRALELYGFDDAIAHYERAMQAIEMRAQPDDAARADLLMRTGDALNRAGRYTESRRAFEDAARLARQLGDAGMLAGAALGAGNSDNIAFAAGAVDEPLIALLEAALDALGPADRPERALILARLASAVLFRTDGRPHARVLSDDAVAIARRLGDRIVLARVLVTHHWNIWAPGNVMERLTAVEEAAALADDAGASRFALAARAWAAYDRLELGDVAASRRLMGEFGSILESVRAQYYEWFNLLWETCCAIAEGRFDDAEPLAQQALVLGQGSGNENAAQLFGAQLAAIRLEQRRIEELRPLLTAAATQNPNLSTAWRISLALVEVEAGNLDAARAIVRELAANECAAMPRDFIFLVLGQVLALITVELGDAGLVREVYRALRPYEGLFGCIPGLCLSAIDISLGELASAAGDYATAETHFTLGLKAAGQAHPYYATMGSMYFARMLVERGGEGDHRRALDMLNACIETATARRWTRVLERSLALKLRLQGSDGATASSSLDAVAATVRAERTAVWQPGSAQPHGAVTIMFSDIEDSTVLTEQLGDDAWQALLRRHNEVIRAQVAACGGYEVKTIGDGFMVVFQSPRRAIECAVAIQRAFLHNDGLGAGNARIQVRIGLHAGEAVREADDFFGKHVIMASRVAGSASGGEVLVSAVVRELVAPAFPPAAFRASRDVTLKGLAGTHTLYVVDVDLVGAGTAVLPPAPGT